MALRAATVWVSLALLQRLEAFLGLLSAHQAAAAAAEAVRCGRNPNTMSYRFLQHEYVYFMLQGTDEGLPIVLTCTKTAVGSTGCMHRRAAGCPAVGSSSRQGMGQGSSCESPRGRKSSDRMVAVRRLAAADAPFRRDGPGPRFFAESALDAILDDLQACCTCPNLHVPNRHAICIQKSISSERTGALLVQR